jgi:hypothetical protein
MTKKDLKVGMVCEVEEHGHRELVMITYNKYGELCYSGATIWGGLDRVENETLTYSCGQNKFMKVYDRSTNRNAFKLSTDNRNLLWERPEYYNGKVVCIKPEIGFTVGKIYEAKEGYLTDDDGCKRPSLPLPMKKLADYKPDKFIEVVE